jgi:hypothetical protein
VAELRQGERQIHCKRSFSDAAFAGTDRDNRFDTRKRLRSLRGLPGTGSSGCIQEITFQIGAWMRPTVNYTVATSP